MARQSVYKTCSWEAMLRTLGAVCVRQVISYRHLLCTCVVTIFLCLVAIRVGLVLFPWSKVIERVSSVTPAGTDKSARSKFKCNSTSGQQVILLTYGRSGSSLTAAIIQQQKEVYMYYEPLHNLAKLFTPLQEEHLQARQRYLHLTSIPEYNVRAVDLVERLMTCNYSQLPRVASLNLHMRLYDSSEMFWCMKRAVNHKKQSKCLNEGEKKCKEKSIHFLKIIRLSTQSVGQLMNRHPCLKMIYLVRDPRGSYLSKKRAFNFMTSNTTYEAERFCTRVRKDIDYALRIRRKYPHRVYLTRYENIAEQPMKTCRQLYKFLALNFTVKVAKYLYNHTQAGTGDKKTYSLARGNSSEVCYAWRSRIKFQDVTTFDQQCREVYYKLGYLPANSEKDLRNLKIALKFEKNYFT